MRLSTVMARAAERPAALVLQVSYANGLGVIRDLGRHGVPVIGLDTKADALGFSSRFAGGMVCPDPHDDEAAFVAFLEHLGERLPQPAVVFPTHDEFIWPLSRHAGRLQRWYRIPFSRWPVMERLYDKRSQIEAAWRAGVDTPRTAFVERVDDLETAGAAVTYPAVLKPVDATAFKLRFHKRLIDIETPARLAEVWPQVRELVPLILQERVPGNDDELFTVGSYLDAESRPLAIFTGHKIRQHPAGAGGCRLGVSKWDAELAEAGLRLLRELSYHGISQVEFKRDPRDGKYRLMEVNARHWMWHSLATACGVNLSLAAYMDAIGQPFLAPRQVDGLKWVVATKDVPLSVREILHREQTLRGWLGSLRDTKVDGVLTLDDPMPGLRCVGRVAAQVVTRRPSARVEI